MDLFYLGIDKLNPSRIFTVKFLFLLYSLDHHIVVYCFNCDILDCIVIGNYLVNWKKIIINLVRIGKPSTFVGLWAMPEDKRISEDDWKVCMGLGECAEEKGRRWRSDRGPWGVKLPREIFRELITLGI